MCGNCSRVLAGSDMDERLRRELALRAQLDPMIHPLIKADLLKRLADLPKPDPEEK